VTAGGWAAHAAAAARDRVDAGRPLDKAWVTRLECDAITAAHEGGGDVYAALSDVRLGVAWFMGWVPRSRSPRHEW
jgi:hypothetical protein